jgi:excisionase family DNA binding protein
MNRTHCGKGHELTEDNIIIRKDGSRVCKTCQRTSERECQRRRRKNNPRPKLSPEERAQIRQAASIKRWHREPDPEWLTLEEAAQYKGVHIDSIRAAIRREAIVSHKVKGHRLIERAVLDEYTPRTYPGNTKKDTKKG